MHNFVLNLQFIIKLIGGPHSYFSLHPLSPPEVKPFPENHYTQHPKTEPKDLPPVCSRFRQSSSPFFSKWFLSNPVYGMFRCQPGTSSYLKFPPLVAFTRPPGSSLFVIPTLFYGLRSWIEKKEIMSLIQWSLFKQ